jgi:hypothetical protein
MPYHERELIDRANAEQERLLREIEEGLERCRQIIAQIDYLRALRNQPLLEPRPADLSAGRSLKMGQSDPILAVCLTVP